MQIIQNDNSFVLPCAVCGKQLEAALGNAGGVNQPYAGTAFSTPGHYGSTIFDPMDGSTIEITICDSCVANIRDKGRIMYRMETEHATVAVSRNFIWTKEK